MELKLEQVEGISDWDDQDVVFKESNPDIICAELELANVSLDFRKESLEVVKKLKCASCRFQHAAAFEQSSQENELNFLRVETGHLKDVCQTYGFGLAGQVSDLLYKLLDGPAKPDGGVMKDFDDRLKILGRLLK